MDIILVRWCFISVMSMTCILHMQWYAGSPQYSLVSFIYLSLYMCMCLHLFFLDMHTILEELTLYWPSKFFAHFGNGCQWGRSFEDLKGIGFYALVLFLSICLACFASLCVASHG
jgi:hypothetical protein